MSKNNDDPTVLLIIAAIILGIVGYWVHVKVQAASAFVGVDTTTMYAVLKRVLAVAVLSGIAIYLGWFRKLAPYLLVGAFVCALPILDSWSAAVPVLYSEFGEKGEAKWYGETWLQVIGFIGLFGLAFYLSNRDE